MGNDAKRFWRLVALLVLVTSMFGAMGLSATALSSNPSGGQVAQIGVDDLLDDALDGSDGTIIDDTVDDSLDVFDDLADGKVDDSLDVLDDLADGTVDDSLDVLPDSSDGSDDTIIDDIVDDSLDVFDDLADDTVDDSLDVLDDSADDAVDDSLDVLPDADDGTDDSILDDTIDDSLDVVDGLVDDGTDVLDDGVDLLDGGSDDGESSITAAALPRLTADICLSIDIDGDGVILDADAEAALQLDLDGDGSVGDLDDLLLVELGRNGGCDSLISPTLNAEICLDLDVNDDGIVTNAELEALLLVDIDTDGEVGDLDDLLLLQLAVNGGCADDGGSGPTSPPVLTVDICIILDLDDDGLISDTELDAIVLVDADGDGTVGDIDDLLLIQLAVNGGCADGGDPGLTDPPILTVDICLDLDLDGNGIITESELAAIALVDLDGDGTVGDLDDLLLVQLAVNGGCADGGDPGAEDTPVLTVDVCVILDADGDGIVLEADALAALLLDLDDDGTVGDLDDLLLIQLAVNGGCAVGGDPDPTDPPVLTVDVCVMLDADGDGVVLEADATAALLLDLDDDGTVGDLDDLLLIQLAINGGCGDDDGPDPDGPPILTVDVCLILDADGDGIVLEADALAALLLDLDDDGTVGDVDDLLLIQLAINGGCGDDDGPIDPPVVTVDVCLILDANADGIVLTADAAAALLLDLDGDGTIGDLDDLLLIQLAVNGGCADDGVSDDSSDTDVLDDGTDTDVLDDSTDTDVLDDGTDTDVLDDSTDTDVLDDGTDTDVLDDGTDTDAVDDDSTDADSGDGDGSDDADSGDSDGTDADSGDSDDDSSVTSLPSTGQGDNDDGGTAIILVFSLIGLIALAAAIGWQYLYKTEETS